ncbi:hypothetical protein PCIT_a3670 [Pseudoalteromonas citrea]|uniref:Carrier domain-containing protein n=2 Tax=Pseudoalteromonas citrea TaxID=43655 RepID=A0AAD4AGB7_9GAMM|nr:amino acid adenylation domain-containing protein [Pseudoalteromonas citrea]KAF7767617.1 hypothetical protein PCIT_a3670 [Pseudoalteromonas citrea]
MIADYVEEYQEGVPLTAVQQLLNKQDSAVNQILYKCEARLTTEAIRQRAQSLLAGHISISSCYKKIAGFTSHRGVPFMGSSVNVQECAWSFQREPNLAQLNLSAPLDIAPEQGVNLDVCVVTSAGDMYIALRSFALALDVTSLQLIAQYIISDDELEEALQFPDFVAWQLDMFDDEEGLAGQAYWQHYLSNNLPGALNLPYKKREIDTSNVTYSHLSHQFTGELVSQVEQFAETLNLTVFQVIQLSWWWLLARLAPQHTFLTQLNYDPRSESEEFEGALGCYNKELPIIVEYDTEQTFKSWLMNTAEVVETHLQWAECITVEQLALVATHNGAVNSLNTGTLECSSEQQSELQLTILDDHTVSICFADQCYSGAAISSILTQLEQILKEVVRTGGEGLNSTISLLSEVEKQQHLALNKADNSQPELLHERIAQFAVSQPNVLAINDGHQCLTYAQLQTQITEFAVGLHTHTQGKDQPVALLLPRSADMAVAMLAAMQLGVGYVPLDPDWPKTRIEQVLGQFNDMQVIDLEGKEGHAFSTIAKLGVNATILPDALGELAYVIFTSGSTGTPKGVQINQQQLAQYCYASSKAMELDEQSHFALTAAVTADLGYTCLFNALYLGKSLHIADELQSKERDAFEAFLTDNEIDCIKIVPSHLQALCDTAALTYVPRKLILGGEACPATFLCSLQQWAPNSEVYNHYGPSEATVGVMSHLYAENGGGVAKLSEVFDGTEIFILNEQQQLCATGEIGQLYIAGSQLALGYLNTQSSAFVTDTPWAERIYATGDLARYMPDNSIMILGRKDDQVKIRGVRIEPQEIAKTIESALNVEHCVVLSNVINNEHVLVAYLYDTHSQVGQVNGEDIAEIQLRLRENLPDVMIPNCFYYVHEWPRMGNGKIDKKSLPQYQHGRSETFIAPKGELEQNLAQMFADVLGVQRVSTEQSFFLLGGHSIAAIKLVKRWADKYESALHFELATLFQAPSVALLAQAIEQQSQALIAPLKYSQSATKQLICIHDGLGLTLAYRALAAQLPEHVNVYGLAPQLADLTKVDNFDELAEHYATAIASQFEQQVVEILGWSMGGVLATKVSACLSDKGIQVKRLVIADTWLANENNRIDENTSVREFIADLVEGENTQWTNSVDTFLTEQNVESLSGDNLSQCIAKCWDLHAAQLAEPLNAIRGEQVARTYATSNKLLELRNKGCHVPHLPHNVQDVQVVWASERAASSCSQFTTTLATQGVPITSLNLEMSHEQIVSSAELAQLLTT